MLKLLVPIDGSERSKQSIDWIKDRYKSQEVSVTLLIVHEDWDNIRCKDQYAAAKEETLPLFQQSADTLSGFSVATEVRFGRAGKEILRFAEEKEIDDTIAMTKSTKSAAGEDFSGQLYRRIQAGPGNCKRTEGGMPWRRNELTEKATSENGKMAAGRAGTRLGMIPRPENKSLRMILGKTQGEVKEKLKKALDECQGLDVSKAADEYTVATWLRTWYELYAKPNVRTATANRAAGIYSAGGD